MIANNYDFQPPISLNEEKDGYMYKGMTDGPPTLMSPEMKPEFDSVEKGTFISEDGNETTVGGQTGSGGAKPARLVTHESRVEDQKGARVTIRELRLDMTEVKGHVFRAEPAGV